MHGVKYLCINILIPFLSDEGPTLEMLDYTIRIGSTPTFLYFDLFLRLWRQKQPRPHAIFTLTIYNISGRVVSDH